MSIIYALFYVAGLVSLVVFWRRGMADGSIRKSAAALGWALPSALLLVALSVIGFLGFIEGAFTCVVAPLTSAIITCSGIVSLKRDELMDRFGITGERFDKRHVYVLVFAILLISLLVTEVPYSSYIPFMGPTHFWLEMLLEGLLLAALYFMGQRHAAFCLPAALLFFICGISQHFVKRFKNSAILPTDLLVLDTAAAVGGEYVFTLNEQSLLGISCLALLFAALSLVPAPKVQEKGPRPALRNLGLAALCSAALSALVLVPSYADVFGLEMRYWYSIDCYQAQGFLPSFITVLQDMPIRKPKGYTDDLANETLKRHARSFDSAAAADDGYLKACNQFAELDPSVICVMNESFADLSVFDGMHAGYTGPTFFQTGMPDSLATGTLNVTVHGAGTCNTEFEFLTGNSLSFVGVGKYPYSIYDLSDIDALPAHFKELGYRTYAIHPNYETNWNRHKIYPAMGFDRFFTIDDFGGAPDPATDTTTPNPPHAEVFHSGVSDRATYDLMLEMLEKDDSPQFFFDVTMANHGSYDQNNIPPDYQLSYVPSDFTGIETPARLNEYLSCIKRSDDDLAYLIDRLRNMERPVVLVFFGDHQPVITQEYNDYWYPNEDPDVHARRIFSTCYVVWANYDVEGCAQTGEDKQTSVDLLGSETLGLIGAPLTDFEKAQLDIASSIPSLSAAGYLGADGVWYEPKDESEWRSDYEDLSLIEYLTFARRL